ncbi:HAD-IC family P-type ATPase [Streptomyces albus subsp. chlorinus]|uniref:HAD-IC family P-type ATPase n=1 Tax=Streptomyces albus TaxID=1888 RepID=UPI00156F8A1C|nr:HAD-IC family P-type ATPase [Streptomyces albus subsp. chlorinus]
MPETTGRSRDGRTPPGARDGAPRVRDGAAPGEDGAAPGAASTALTALTALRRLETGPRGLTEAEAGERLVRYGENTPPAWRTPSLPRRLAASVREPFTAVLLCLVVVSAVAGSLGMAGVTAALVTVSCLLRARGELRADRSVAGLRALVTGTVTVLRRTGAGDGAPRPRELPAGDLVPGDVVRLGPGDMVPADVLLLRSTGLVVHQAPLTGESAPLPKEGTDTAAHLTPSGAALFEQPHLCFQGSSVVSGSGTAVVVATGADTRLAAGHQHARPPQRAFDRSLRGIARVLVRFMLLTPPLALAADAALSGRGVRIWPFAVAVAVGLIPEMLPVVRTAVLTRGAVSLAREHQVIVRRLPALHDLGAMDVLCLDKTGTLTRDRPVVEQALDADGAPDPGVLRWAARNALWTLQLAETPVPDALDEAILRAAAEQEHDRDHGHGHDNGHGFEGEDEYEGVAALPFDPARRVSAAVLRAPGHRLTHTLVVKGAVEAVLERCALDEPERAALRERAARYAADGLRLLAVATAERRPRADARHHGPADEYGLTFTGFVTLRDALTSDAAEALHRLAGQGVAVKVLTGDHPGTAVRTCRELGLDPGEADVLTAGRIDALGDDDLARAAERTTVFARCTPRHKARVVAALRAAGHTTGFLGDGVNDLAALHAADVGLCPREAVATVRESADVVFGGQPFAALPGTVTAGRRCGVALVSYLRVALSSNLGNALAMLVAALLFPFVPMLPAQVLTQNLFFDAAQLAFAFDRHSTAALRAPAALRPREILRFLTGFGVLNAAADLATFAVLATTVEGAADADGGALFHAGWFTENLLTQAIVMLLLRTGRRPGRAAFLGPVAVAAGLLAATGVLLPLTPLGPALGMDQALTPLSYLLLGLVLAAYGTVLTWSLRRHARRHPLEQTRDARRHPQEEAGDVRRHP